MSASVKITEGQSVEDVVAGIRQAMSKAQVSQRQLAKRLEMDEAQVSRQLSGRYDLRLSTVLRFLTAIV